MTNNQADMVAYKLSQMGFGTQSKGNQVLVWLNRSVGVMEVKTALTQEFDEVEFDVGKQFDKVVVK